VSGALVLVATPIGNLADMSARATEALAAADVVCCEDTRHSGQLFARLGFRPKRLLSLHEHNEQQRVADVLGFLAADLTVAVVSDAGMPAVSDPGARVVAAAHEAGAQVSVVPGASAATAAVAVAGFGGNRWRFEGFLPRKATDRRARLAALAAADEPVVIYEAPGRVDALLADLVEACGPGRLVAVCRELTKLHEEVWRGPLGDGLGRWPATVSRGEFVLVLDEAPTSAPLEIAVAEIAAGVEALVAAGSSRRDAVAEMSDRTGLARRAIYDAIGPARPAARPTGR
jgi:16S rRNA (cytidine1402-2'-O)-methyltransferase